MVLALYDGADEAGPRSTVIHALAEMPLNHLGVVRYHDITRGLPALDSLADVRGVLTWFGDESMPDPRTYLQWVDAISRRGTPVAVIGSIGAFRDDHAELTPLDDINRTMGRVGWRYDGGWHTTTYGARYLLRDARTLLRVAIDGRPATSSDLVIVSPRGGYIAPGYAYFDDCTETIRTMKGLPVY